MGSTKTGWGSELEGEKTEKSKSASDSRESWLAWKRRSRKEEQKMEISTQRRTKQLLDQQETFSEDPRRKLLLFVRRRQSSAALGPRGGCEEQEGFQQWEEGDDIWRRTSGTTVSMTRRILLRATSVQVQDIIDASMRLFFLCCAGSTAYFHNKMHIYLFCL